MEYTPNGWSKKRYAQCCKELEQHIDIQNKKLQAYKDKEDKLREYCRKQENDGYCTTITQKHWVIDLLQILNDKE